MRAEHSTAVAIAAKLLAKYTKANPDDAFLLGMLHDVGVVVEMQLDKESLSRVIDAMQSDDASDFMTHERSIIGASHEQFGRALCRSWKFPVSIQDAVGGHHDASELQGDARKLAMTLLLADYLATEAGSGYPGTQAMTKPDAELSEYGIGDELLEEIAEQMRESGDLAATLSG